MTKLYKVIVTPDSLVVKTFEAEEKNKVYKVPLEDKNAMIKKADLPRAGMFNGPIIMSYLALTPKEAQEALKESVAAKIKDLQTKLEALQHMQKQLYFEPIPEND